MCVAICTQPPIKCSAVVGSNFAKNWRQENGENDDEEDVKCCGDVEEDVDDHDLGLKSDDAENAEVASNAAPASSFDMIANR